MGQMVLRQHSYDPLAHDIPTGWEQSFIHATRHLIDALHDNTPPCLTGDQGRTILRSLLAAHHSASTGRSVRI